MFTLKGGSIDAIPPTADALLLHVYKRVSYQADCCWGQFSTANLKLPNPVQRA